MTFRWWLRRRPANPPLDADELLLYAEWRKALVVGMTNMDWQTFSSAAVLINMAGVQLITATLAATLPPTTIMATTRSEAPR